MVENDVQYQQRTTACSNWEVLEKMLETLDETVIEYEDFKVVQDYIALHYQRNACYLAKRKYDENKHLWLCALGAERKVEKLRKEISEFESNNSDVLKKWISVGREIMDQEDRRKDKLILIDYRKKQPGAIHENSRKALLNSPDFLEQKIKEILPSHENQINKYLNDIIFNATMFCVGNYTGGDSEYLLNSELALTDAMAFAMFVNCKEILKNTYRYELIEKIEQALYNNCVNVLAALLRFPRVDIKELFDNRIKLYNRLYNASDEQGVHKFNSALLNFRFILIQDKEQGKYMPFDEESAIDLISIFEMQKCAFEINGYLSNFFDMFDEGLRKAWDYLADAEELWDEYEDDLDEESYTKPVENKRFHLMSSALKRGLESYCKKQNNDKLNAFTTALFESLSLFAYGEESDSFDFSVKLTTPDSIEYIDFHIEDSYIEVISGGTSLNKEAGADSYTSWRYAVWNDGNEDSYNVTEDFADDILYTFESAGVDFAISTPDEFAYDSETEREELHDCFGEVLENWFSSIASKIYYYKNDGSLDKTEYLSKRNLENINGMLVKCHLKNGMIHVGYAAPYGAHDQSEFTEKVGDMIYLWTWDNIDEATHQLVGNEKNKYSQTYIPVKVDYITRVDAILFSNPRWGGKLTNQFYIDVN